MPVTKAQLLQDLHTDAEAVPSAVQALPAAAWEEGIYEHGWNARQLLAHLAAIEWTYPKLIERAEQAQQPTAADSSSSGRFDMDAYNHKQVQRRADLPPAQLLTEFQRNRAATIDAVRAAPDALLQQPTRSAGGVEGTLLDVLHSVAVGHVREHLRDLVEGGQTR